jgi:hypothetical protein
MMKQPLEGDKIVDLDFYNLVGKAKRLIQLPPSNSPLSVLSWFSSSKEAILDNFRDTPLW